jgi:hypothetical protein
MYSIVRCRQDDLYCAYLIFMKQLRSIGIAVVTIACMCGCKQDCNEADIDLNLVYFTDFETNNIEVSRYTKGSNFTLKIETATLVRGNQNYQRNTDTVILPHPVFISGNRMTTGFDYEVNVVNAGKIFRITEIVEEERSDNTKGKELCINPIISYKVNGQSVTGVNWDPFYLKK